MSSRPPEFPTLRIRALEADSFILAATTTLVWGLGFQALVLTAIVIGFALFVFALAVLKRSWELHDNVETDRITAVAEEPAPDLAPKPVADGHATPARAAETEGKA